MNFQDYLAALTHKEVTLQRDTVRQAGTIEHSDPQRSEFLTTIKSLAERNLYYFTKAILQRHYLSPTLHRDVCAWLQQCPPSRKLLLLPRRCAKTSIVSHGLPVHLLIQPEQRNIYGLNKAGANTRILLVGETWDRAKNNLRVIQHIFESNTLVRKLWPEVCFDSPRKESPKWNERELIVNRTIQYPDPSVLSIGVGSAITGARVDVMIKDDLISVDAANSELVMRTAISWHINSRALFDDQDRGLEMIIGTRWAVFDLYSYIMEHDPSVAVLKRSLIENGESIYPEAFPPATVDRLRKEFGNLFPLLYMNEAHDPSLTHFDLREVRSFTITDGTLTYTPTDKDDQLCTMYTPTPEPQRGWVPLRDDAWDILTARANEFHRFVHT